MCEVEIKREEVWKRFRPAKELSGGGCSRGEERSSTPKLDILLFYREAMSQRYSEFN
jgi:hypothetical protein